MDKFSWIKKELLNLRSSGLFIDIKTIQSQTGAKIKVNGSWVLNFCSNNYLGLANHPRILKASKRAIDKYGIGPAAVRTIAGTTSLHLNLEKILAEFKKTEAVILLQSGYAANLATIPTLVQEGDIIFSDELNHASIIDGCRLSKAKVLRYKHCDPEDLEQKVKSQNSKARKLIVTDGVFSMDGDIAPLPELVEISSKYNAILVVDDAHGEGVLGKNGRGVVDHFHLHGQVDIEIGTLSKAFGVVGGYVAGKKVVIEWLRQKARPFLFSSALTIPDVAASIEAIKILSKSDSLVKKLWKNTNYFKQRLKKMGFDIGNSQTPIVPIMLGEAKLAQKFSKKLFENKVFATAIGYPTVPRGLARIRVIISANHSRTNLDRAIDVFEKVGKELQII